MESPNDYEKENVFQKELYVKFAQHEQLPINAMARVVIQLGEQLIENEIVALLEIVKNSYDADAKNIFIEIDTLTRTNLGQGFIRIRDNGNGMNREQIQNGFLVISTLSKTKKELSPRYNRIPLGEKGVGRLSTQRLAHFLNVKTKSWKEEREYLLSIDWRKFNDEVLIGKVEANLDNNVYSEAAVDEIHDGKYLPKHITDGLFGFSNLSMYGLLNLDYWNQEGIEKILAKEVIKLISPFKKNNNVSITINLTNSKLTNEVISTNNIDEDFLEKASLYKVIFHFKYPVLQIAPIFKPIFYKSLEGKESRTNLPDKYIENHIPVDEKIQNIDLTQENDKLKYNLRKTAHKGKLINANPGEFSGVFYVYNYGNDPSVKELYSSVLSQYSKLFEDSKDIKDFLKENVGVKIFRDLFRVLPYGNEDNDWLGFTKLSQSIGSYFGPKVHNTIGYIEITSDNNSNLKEMTNRQGFILDPYGENFISICKEVATIISRESYRQSTQFNKLHPKIVDETAHETLQNTINQTSSEFKEILVQTQKIASDLRSNTDPNQQSLFEDPMKNALIEKAETSISNLIEKAYKVSSNLDKATNEIQVAKKIFDFTKEEVEPLFELSSLGIIAEALTHELNKANINTRFRAQEIQSMLLVCLRKIEAKEDVNALIKKAYGEIRLIEAETNSIERQIRHLAPGFRQRKRSKQLINLNDELKMMYIDGIMSQRAAKAGIKMKLIENGDIYIECNQGLIMQIFDNLYLNSEHWLHLFYSNNEIEVKEFIMRLNSDYTVEVWDSGKGIDPTIENVVFFPFQTLKKDGRGLGLYIVNNLLENQGGNIRLAMERNDFKRRFKFVIDFSGMKKEPK
ncbi:hypothetical protein FE784_22265 [Paenibacillus hemerocallicola]|uniref:histidine kinase n=1 Tax=Paenibacillus hemerocallicola TaxID=1172614 RepID=A0A5C4T5D8_9BACL|nr:ATP-binding protein [Paenibacillus hemerocallicola]TNJ64036.1 hypothetical protein FE784_22265 [Paenibacillus hemerocallicola]